MSQQPIFILREGTERTQGKTATERNVMVAVTLAESIRTSLGPRGLDKMLVDTFGDALITNDGATILKEMDVQHPIAKFIVELAKTQDQEVGDGTTTVVVLAGELLKLAGNRLSENVHPTVLVEGYRKATEKSVEFLKEISLKVESDNRDLLKNVVTTTLNSKVVYTAGEKLVDIVVDSVLSVRDGDKVDLDNIKVEKKVGGSIEETTLIRGILLDKDVVHPDMPKKITDAKIALIDDNIELQKTEFDAEISITSPDQIKAFKEREASIINDLVVKIQESGANVLLCSKGIDDLAQHGLAKAGILSARRIKRSDMAKLARATGGIVVTNIKELTSEDLGSAGLVEERMIGKDEMIFVEECVNPRAVTILIRGSTDMIIDEADRSLHDAVCVVKDVVESKYIVYGGGSPEMAVAQKLRKYSESLGGREQLAVLDFADALEIIPRTLAENIGLDPLDTMANLHQKIAQKFTYGIDPYTRGIKDFEGTHVMEPMIVKRQAITAASEAAQMILRIDDIISSKGTGGGAPQMPPGMGGY